MAAKVVDPLTDYSKTQRVVLLIDLNPLLHLQDANPYLKTLLSSSKTLLSFPPLSSSLFSFKPFFSSLSPLLSSSKLPSTSTSLSLSFNHPDSTLHSLTEFLTSLPTTINKSSFPLNPSKALNLAASLRQLVHDYAWDPLIPDPVAGTLSNSDSSDLIRSNLVILFSPVYRHLNGLCEFFDVEMEDECLRNLDAFVDKFSGVFDSVNDAFVSRDIHCCWVDVKFQSWENEDFENLGYGFLESGIRSLGWGFCSADSIVLGSALVPFGLIYPIIGVSSNCFRGFDFNDDSGRRMNAQLSLEISDASGKPLECKCCELEFVHFKMCSRNKNGDVLFTPEFSNPQMRGDDQKLRSMFEQYSDGVMTLCVRTVRKYDGCEKFEGHFLNPIIVREYWGNSRKDPKDNLGEFFADRALQILARDMGESLVRKPVPIWQIFLSFLYREGYWALVSLSDGNCDLHTGILKPFTVSSAILCIIDDEFCTNNKLQEYRGEDVAAYVSKRDDEISKSNVDSKHSSGILDSQSHPSPSIKCASKRKKNKKNLHLLHEMTWSTFSHAAAEHLEINLEESYFSRNCNNSKKLKFLKCWMKQIKKCSSCSLKIPESANPDQDATEEMNHRPIELPQDSEQPASYSASAGEGSSRILDEAGNEFCSETLENFFNSLPNKIKQGLESGEVELGAFAERLVSSSIYWLYQKHEMEDNSESQTSVVKANDACASKAAVELTELLLREPKDIAAMHKRRDPFSQASDSRSTGSAFLNIVREYELQILFRMEILQSEVGAIIEEPMRQKFVKQICLLLESIQCHLEGGFFGDWRLDKYVEKIIKSRYYQSLRDVVDKIYTKMDLLLFDDEDELPNHLLNSEGSNQSWKEKPEKDVNYRKNEPVSIGDESPQVHKNDNRSPQVIRTKEHAQKLIEAQERRERARRFSSFTSWMPHLQRVWVPKQPKAMKLKSEPLRKLSKRKNCSRANYDMVCETPITEKKRSSPRRIGIDEEEGHRDCGAHSHGSVSKALFQDDIQ
ncbi:LIM domain-containing protein A, putative isoform 1 [Theobroma cacao]|uniref:LIM domain-containing protein A, putative isoform 1 n=2 Tax=Theobroma cacao TaxID=3641 RepID=A0A061G8M8_THECC|nr:LIM domain-containing protein A, putative isoform 1 [Theobroma cacao]